jgi:hypothetical protein
VAGVVAVALAVALAVQVLLILQIQRKFLFHKEIFSKYLFNLESFRNC